MSIRERLYPTEQELSVLLCHCSDARYVWNLGLEQRNYWKRERSQKVTFNTQTKELTEARQAFTWLTEGSSAVQQQALRDLDKAFKNCGRGRITLDTPPGARLVSTKALLYGIS